MGDTVPLLRTSPERSTQDPVKDVGVSDIIDDDDTDTKHELFIDKCTWEVSSINLHCVVD